jgi:hypothetical protein
VAKSITAEHCVPFCVLHCKQTGQVLQCLEEQGQDGDDYENTYPERHITELEKFTLD